MHQPLDAIRAKVERGEQHTNAVREELRRTFDSDPPGIGFREYADLETQEWVLTITEVDDLPLKVGVLIGDALHNFRSALDQMVFELAFIDTKGREMEKTAFPCSTTLDNWRSTYVQNTLLAGLSKTHRTVIQRLQPYRRWEWPDLPPMHPFALLNDLSNDDKHRLVQPTLVFPVSIEFDIPHVGQDCHVRDGPIGGESVIGRPAEVGADLIRIPIEITGPNPHMEVKTDAQAQVCFRNGIPADGLVDQVAKLTRLAVETVAPEFSK